MWPKSSFGFGQPNTCLWLTKKKLGSSSELPKWAVIKNMPANVEDIRDVGLIPGSGRSPGIRNNNPFQYSCLDNSMDKGASWATVHGVTRESDTTKYAHVCLGCAWIDRVICAPGDCGFPCNRVGVLVLHSGKCHTSLSRLQT